MKKVSLLIAGCFLSFYSLWSQTDKHKFTRLDSLSGSNTPQRAWWDVEHYAVTVAPDYSTKTIRGKTTIRYKVISDQPHAYLQLDLKKPLVLS